MCVSLSLIHSIGWPTDSSWEITSMICQKIKINSNCNTLTSSVSVSFFYGGGCYPPFNLGLRVLQRFLIWSQIELPTCQIEVRVCCWFVGAKQLDKLNLQILRYYRDPPQQYEQKNWIIICWCIRFNSFWRCTRAHANLESPTGVSPRPGEPLLRTPLGNPSSHSPVG